MGSIRVPFKVSCQTNASAPLKINVELRMPRGLLPALPFNLTQRLPYQGGLAIGRIF